MTDRARLDPVAAAMDCQLLADVLACVRRFRAQVRHDAQRVREIQHLRTAARLLFEDRPDKNRAVEAIKHISARHAVLLTVASRAWLAGAEQAALDPLHHVDIDSGTSTGVGGGVSVERDWGEQLDWHLRVNRAGQFPFTQGADDATDASAAQTSPPDVVPPHPVATGVATSGAVIKGATSASTDAATAATTAATDPAMQLATALRSAWRAANDVLRSATERSASAQEQAHAHSPPAAIAFDEPRDAAHRALASAARRVWAVTMRDQFGATGESLKLRMTPALATPQAAAAVRGGAIDRTNRPNNDRHLNLVDEAEDALLAALVILATPVELADD